MADPNPAELAAIAAARSAHAVALRAAPWRRRLVVTAWVMAALPLLSIGTWVAIQQIDEAPSADALRLSQPYENTVPDADNAWLLLAGLGAPAGVDPIAFGRDRVDAYDRWVAAGTPSTAPHADAALFDDVLGMVPDDLLCPVREVDCIDWMAGSPRRNRAADEHRVALDRYRMALAMTEAEELGLPSLLEPAPGVPGAALSIARLHVQDALAGVGQGGDPAAALDALARSNGLWILLGERARSAGLRLAAIRLLEENLWLLSSIIDRLDDAALARLAGPIAAARAPFPAALRDWRFVARHQHQAFVASTHAALPGFWASVRRQAGREAPDWQEPLLALAFAPQASANHQAAMWQVAEDLLHGGIDDWEQREATVGKRLAPWMDPIGSGSGRHPGHDRVGRTLVPIALPRLDFVLRSADLDALRLAVDLKWWAREQGVPPAHFEEWLERQPPGVREPIRDLGLLWHAAAREIRFAPHAAADWQRPWLGVAYTPRVRFDARRCLHVLRITLWIDDGVDFQPAHRMASCGSGRIDLQPWRLDASPTGPASDVRVDAGPDAARLRVALQHAGKVVRYDTDSAYLDAGAPGRMVVEAHPIGDAPPGLLHVEFEPIDNETYLALDMTAWPAADALAAVADAAGVRVRGDAGDARITLKFDAIPAMAALEFIADSAGRALREDRTGVLALGPPEERRPQPP